MYVYFFVLFFFRRKETRKIITMSSVHAHFGILPKVSYLEQGSNINYRLKKEYTMEFSHQ